jgi:hypothetical protein
MVLTRNAPGLAYGVFKCSDPRPRPLVLARFKDALENVKAAHEETKIPPETEFSVLDIETGKYQVRVNGELVGLLNRIVALETRGANLMIISAIPGAPNEIAARDLGDTLNMLYGGTELFEAESEGRAQLVMDVFFRDGDKYRSKLALDLADINPKIA